MVQEYCQKQPSTMLCVEFFQVPKSGVLGSHGKNALNK
jgi:hypothetical protein